MSKMYQVEMLDAGTGMEGDYEFEAEDDLFTKSPMAIVRRFMEYVDEKQLPKEHVDYETYSVLKNKEHQVVTAMGNLILDRGELPFMLMISPKRER